MTNYNPQFDVDHSTMPPSCLPTDLDRSNLMDITRLGDSWKRYVDTKTGETHDGSVYIAEAWRLGPERRADGMPRSADERYLRRMLALRAGLPHTYYGDGEARGAEHGISIDFMREPVADIDAKLRALNVARYECSKTPNVPLERRP